MSDDYSLIATGDGKYWRTHAEGTCSGEFCCIHNPSDHHMREWQLNIRAYDNGTTERICPHGIGHPDPDALAHELRLMPGEEGKWLGVHGCDGCCRPGLPADDRESWASAHTYVDHEPLDDRTKAYAFRGSGPTPELWLRLYDEDEGVEVHARLSYVTACMLRNALNEFANDAFFLHMHRHPEPEEIDPTDA